MSSTPVPCQDFNSLLYLQPAGLLPDTPHLTGNSLPAGAPVYPWTALAVESIPPTELRSASLLSFFHSFLSPSLSTHLLSAIVVSDEDTKMNSHDPRQQGAHSPIGEQIRN